MGVLVTGAAGFIGFHVARGLIQRGERVVGVDNLVPYYSVELKRARLAQLDGEGRFTFLEVDVADPEAMAGVLAAHPDIDRVVHMAAQAGVRYSLENPHAYVRANVDGQLAILELCRRLSGLRHLVYASSSSVYGGNRRLPFAAADRVDDPVSLYAATKRAAELMSQAYGHLFAIPMTGLRFFTVYGPWGRPDMSAYIFTRAIFEEKPVPVFNRGEMKRDFTYIDDVVQGVLAAIDRPPTGADGGPPHRLYNLGHHRSEELMRLIGLIEQAVGRKARIEFLPMQPGDVKETYADIESARRDLGFHPRTSIDEGIPRFVEWFRAYHRL
ncbi:MAG: NAD-dependent epimerase/dehydratase family protein [Kiloniellales bacterium]